MYCPPVEKYYIELLVFSGFAMYESAE